MRVKVFDLFGPEPRGNNTCLEQIDQMDGEGTLGPSTNLPYETDCLCQTSRMREQAFAGRQRPGVLRPLAIQTAYGLALARLLGHAEPRSIPVSICARPRGPAARGLESRA